MDAAIERDADRLTAAGVISIAANRKALRLGEESVDEFRVYLAAYAREQARCLYSPALIRNLEENWRPQERRP
jgi:thioesterase DpgC